MPRSPTSLDLIFTHARWTPDEAREVLGSLERSGLTVAEFAAQHSIQAQRLFAWRRKFAGEPAALARPATPTFVEVAARREVARTLPARYELVLADGASLRVEGPIEMGTVRALLALLREAHAC
jgi:transposase-like protein